ncbi:Panacea domain-containing protein [Candidatus Tokpelaia sp.]|uniref:Panacea domain-containing protein n=1 Tax=Candidatus Tokpelaia sp. TaxID=2233777 RepID=UPI00123B3242|nr:type II toxin-antitoxin system antitoxin SocA domain-containing protein [Candidatus Tokpelaia sp.]KAA6405409.1 hypothetical protein DPQ22_04945 [Candidatus Tokpelaia sp.]
MTTVSSQTVANAFISLAKQRNKMLTPMQVLKLVYLAHGWTLGYTGKPLIHDKIEAWKYGPVVPALYETIRAYRSAPIPYPVPAPPDEQLSDEQSDMIRRVYNTYENMDGIQLSNLTHQQNTPWDKIYNQGTGDWAGIPDTLIKEFYQKKVAANGEEA